VLLNIIPYEYNFFIFKFILAQRIQNILGQRIQNVLAQRIQNVLAQRIQNITFLKVFRG
jgi:hypothetical protein